MADGDRRQQRSAARHLGRDVDALSEKVDPRRMVGRRVESARGGVSRVRDRVMGTTSSAASSVREMRDTLREPAQQVVQQVRETTTEAVTEVAGEGRSAARDVADETKTSAANLRHHDRPSGGHVQ